MILTKTKCVAFSGALGVLAGCVETAANNQTMPDADDGAVFFAENCVVCHGASGRGDGPLSEKLAKKPDDLTTLARRNGGEFPTARALSYIYGDPEQGHLARVMPQFGGEMADDLVPLDVDGTLTPTPRALAAVFAYLESIQR